VSNREPEYLPRHEADALAKSSAEALRVAIENHEAVHDAERRGRDKAEINIERRLEGMNEFRAQLDRQAANFVTKGFLAAAIIAAVTITGIVVSIVSNIIRTITT